MRQAEYEYQSKVFAVLWEMEVGQVMTIAQICREKNIEKMIKSVKKFIDLEYDHIEGFEIVFSTDYTQLKKRNYGRNIS